MSVELDMLYTAEGSTIVCTIMWKDSLHSQRILHFIHIQKWSGVYTHIAQVHGHLVMYLHLSSALLCLLQQLHTAPTTTCAKEVKEVVQSMFCRRLTIGHTNNFLTSNQSQATHLYLLPIPQTCQTRQAHSGIQWCPHEEHLQVCQLLSENPYTGSFICTMAHHQQLQQLQELPLPHINWQSKQFHVLPPTLLYYCNC